MEAASRAGAMIDEGVGVRERVAEAQRVLRDRVTFGKSNIHGWGLIAKTHIKAGTMVVPFRGESVRPSVANLREKAYELSGRDCYLLMADPRTVIDTTNKGNVARFTNHSCNPNMYTKIVSADGASHIIFFTRADVKPGEELTYNYRFDAEEGRVPCYCGAYNCRGFLC
jgi:NuA3 HAT complex component NTO1